MSSCGDEEFLGRNRETDEDEEVGAGGFCVELEVDPKIGDDA